MLGKASSPLLEQAEQQIEAKVSGPMKSALARVVNAGLTVMYSPKLAQARTQNLSNSKNPALDAGQGAVRLISNLYQQSNKSMPKPVIVPAATIFMLEYLDLLSHAGKVQITPELIAQSAKVLGDELLKLFNLTPEKIQQVQLMTQKREAAQLPAPKTGMINQAA